VRASNAGIGNPSQPDWVVPFALYLLKQLRSQTITWYTILGKSYLDARNVSGFQILTARRKFSYVLFIGVVWYNYLGAGGFFRKIPAPVYEP